LWADGQRLGPVEVADTPWRRFRGLLGRTSLDGALLLRPCSSVHTLGMQMTIDVARLTKDLEVLDVSTMRPQRLGGTRRGARAVLETEAGVMASWGLRPGSRIEVRPAH
jgi:uncharacterized membrane protein (UPF0127 family)